MTSILSYVLHWLLVTELSDGTTNTLNDSPDSSYSDNPNLLKCTSTLKIACPSAGGGVLFHPFVSFIMTGFETEVKASLLITRAQVKALHSVACI